MLSTSCSLLKYWLKSSTSTSFSLKSALLNRIMWPHIMTKIISSIKKMVVSLLSPCLQGRVVAGECVVMTVMVMLLLLAGLAESEQMRYSEHKKAERKYLVMDPSANYKYFVKVGDMTFMKPEFEEKFGNPRSKRLTSTKTRLFEGGVVCFQISTHYTESERNDILSALSHIENHTCIRFKELRDPNKTDYLVFMKGAGCKSFVGKLFKQPQGVSLASSCFRGGKQKIIHEICHALGLFHEHTRPDRDDYVYVHDDKIVAGARDQFEKMDAEIANTLGVGYDYNSIMHYDSDTFGNDTTCGITITANQPNIHIGPTQFLTRLDIIKLNTLYNCSDEHPPRCTIYDPPEIVWPPLPPCGKRFIDVMKGRISSMEQPHYCNCRTVEQQIMVPEGFQITMLFEEPVQLGSDCSNCYIEIYDRLDCTGYKQTICSNPYYLDYYTSKNTACIRYHCCHSPAEQRGFNMTFTAEDVNECCERCADVCEFECFNTPGSYYCICPEGYFHSPSGPRCLDVNECALMEDNLCDFKCVNYGGSYECICPDGRPQERGVPCNVNECETNNGGCAHFCTDTESSFTCSCRNEYQLQEDGFSCLRIVAPLVVASKVVQPPQTIIEATTTTTATTAATTTTAATAATTQPPCPIVSLPPLPACSTILRDSSGVFSSRNWPSTYNNNEQCDWVIILPDCTKKVRIEFEAFSVAGQMPRCPKDQVYVRNGLDEGSYVGLYCSLTVPEPVVIDSHIVRITMVSGPRHGVRRKGFTAGYQSVDE